MINNLKHNSVKDAAIMSGGGYSRHHEIDKLKTLCAFLIVCIHAPFPGAFGEYFTVLTRIAVPCFLIISGYFFTQDRVLRQIRKVAVLFFEANLIYFVWNAGISIVKGQFIAYLSTTFTVSNIARFLLLNETHLAYHLWYLGALLYVLLIMVVVGRVERITKRNLRKTLYYITPFLLFGDLILGKYSLLFFHREFSVAFVRNWLFVGIPYFTIGMWLKDNSEKWRSVKKRSVITIMIVALVTSWIERLILITNDLNASRDHYLSTTILAVSVFVFFAEYVDKNDNKIAAIGRNDSTWVYILHVIMITVLGFGFRFAGLSTAFMYLSPIIVFFWTLAMIEFIRFLWNTCFKNQSKRGRL